MTVKKTHQFKKGESVMVLKLFNGSITLNGPFNILDIRETNGLADKIKIAELTWITARQCLPTAWVEDEA